MTEGLENIWNIQNDSYMGFDFVPKCSTLFQSTDYSFENKPEAFLENY